ncbi:hypothetical protein AMAG_18377 [Allomyces macrogynus ATCC 38327]|uniref:Uncharacterized protein n=1 Tax=Allomyces macrogynus (strain ATCC 38327) TaxID=578462 RepID=A0A0L0S6W4_ALLM3|nr:hypothetical protein AMAG_18377 [Allomyces macrogynus ATCC 38327]|eukprot:KNE58126.1 hypothetical protein AMAG_18377 [Allomyces macrogynus ATCC 38327]
MNQVWASNGHGIVNTAGASRAVVTASIFTGYTDTLFYLGGTSRIDATSVLVTSSQCNLAQFGLASLTQNSALSMDRATVINVDAATCAGGLFALYAVTSMVVVSSLFQDGHVAQADDLPPLAAYMATAIRAWSTAKSTSFYGFVWPPTLANAGAVPRSSVAARFEYRPGPNFVDWNEPQESLKDGPVAETESMMLADGRAVDVGLVNARVPAVDCNRAQGWHLRRPGRRQGHADPLRGVLFGAHFVVHLLGRLQAAPPRLRDE